MISIFAITNRGLESLCAEEIRHIPGVQIHEVAYRRVHALAPDVFPFLSLKMVDDVFIHLDTWRAVVPQRAALQVLRDAAMRLKMNPTLDVIRSVRTLPASPRFSVTANFVGKRNYTSDEIKTALADSIAALMKWEYTSEDLSELNFRVFIDHEIAYIGVRLGETALHRRAYKGEHILGSLKPPVAAAMLAVGGVTAGESVLDPFCGAGTILIEAALMGAQASGGDHNPAAVQAAQDNAAAARVEIDIQTWDARRLPIPSQSIACIVTNLPWGRQVEVDEEMAAFYQTVCREFERVLQPDGRVVLLTSLPDLVRFERLTLRQSTEISLYGLLPSILVYA